MDFSWMCDVLVVIKQWGLYMGVFVIIGAVISWMAEQRGVMLALGVVAGAIFALRNIDFIAQKITGLTMTCVGL